MCKIARNRLSKCVNLYYRNRCYGNVRYDKIVYMRQIIYEVCWYVQWLRDCL
jgi:hypothetical protein